VSNVSILVSLRLYSILWSSVYLLLFKEVFY